MKIGESMRFTTFQKKNHENWLIGQEAIVWPSQSYILRLNKLTRKFLTSDFRLNNDKKFYKKKMWNFLS